MRVLILGGDGYLGWPTAMHFASRGHDVVVCDNYLRRSLCLQTRSEPLMNTPELHDRADIFKAASGHGIEVAIGDCTDSCFLNQLVADTQPEAVIHYAEQPSAPYSMIGQQEAQVTFTNNLHSTFNLIWAVIQHAPQCHIIKLGTMGEYGTPNIDIEEGYIEIEHKGRKDTFLFPRQGSSLYHTTKVLDTDLLWFYVRTYNLRVTDLMQGPVYGLATEECDLDPRLMPHFNYDDVFGTVVNRFLVQSVAGTPLTVYGKGGQTRGYLNIKDTLRCVELAAETPVDAGELRILNQFTEQFTVLQLAEKIQEAGQKVGLDVKIQSITNPRKEAEDHYYNARHSGLIELGLQPHLMTTEVLVDMLRKVQSAQDCIDKKKIMPRVTWTSS